MQGNSTNAADTVTTLWAAIAQTTPSLSSHVSIHPQHFRGEKWFVLADETTGQHLRLNQSAFALVGRFNSVLTVESIYTFLREEAASAADVNTNENATTALTQVPEKEDIIRLLAQLHSLGALQGLGDRATEKLVAEYNTKQFTQRWRRWFSPLMIRFPLLDPDSFLEKYVSRLDWAFTRTAVLLWLLVLLAGVVTVFTHFNAIRNEVSTDILKPGNLILLWVMYPLLKLVHEFAHAFCVKRWGGEVHEMGITLLVLTPVPYVNASASAAFKSRWRRIAVSASGIVVEVFLASVAIMLWSASEPGFFHDTMLGIFLIGAVSTIAFNANPLLKFDGYYILQDYLEIPNLYSRSGEWYSYVVRRYLMRVEDVSSPQTAAGERRWFAVYGLCSRVYRLVVVFAIALFLSTKLFIVGVALALWALFQQLLMPVVKMLKYLAASPELKGRRRQVVVPVFIAGASIMLLTLLLPLPQNTMAQGVVWTPEQGQIYAPSSGFIVDVHVRPGHRVEAGELLITMENPELEQRLAVEQARLDLLEIEHGIAVAEGGADSSRSHQDMLRQKAITERYANEVGSLELRSSANGTFVFQDQSNLLGQYFSQGHLIGHVVDPDKYIVQVVVPERDSGPLHKGIRAASVRLAEDISSVHPASVIQSTPAASNQLPSSALGAAGGGGIAVASSDSTGLTSSERVFHLQLSFDQIIKVSGVGERAFVKLKHEDAPLGTRLYRLIQQTFLSNVPAWIG